MGCILCVLLVHYASFKSYVRWHGVTVDIIISLKLVSGSKKKCSLPLILLLQDAVKSRTISLGKKPLPHLANRHASGRDLES
jgi:hypothetical protein